MNLISQAAKIGQRILTKVLTTRAKHPGGDQFGLRSGCATKEAISTMKMLEEKALDHDLETFVCFIDFEEAFSGVQWDKLMWISKINDD